MTVEVEVLEKVKAYLESGHCYGICHALDRVRQDSYVFTRVRKKSNAYERARQDETRYTRVREVDEDYAQAASKLLSLISKRLGPKTKYLNEWLEKKGVPAEDINSARLRQHRLAWLDILIKEFS